MKVLLIDADSTIPNIALMKLSFWHKAIGDDVELVRANLPYFPNRRKVPFIAKDADKTWRKPYQFLLSKINYLNEYIFAFDSWKYKTLIEKKMPLLAWRKPYQLKFFVYIHPDMLLTETVKRIAWLKENQCLPYIMRDISCWQSKNSDFFVDLAAYCNQVHLFKKMEFTVFLEKRHKNKERIERSKRLWNENKEAK